MTGGFPISLVQQSTMKRGVDSRLRCGVRCEARCVGAAAHANPSFNHANQQRGRKQRDWPRHGILQTAQQQHCEAKSCKTTLWTRNPPSDLLGY
eukprot:3937429-Rhodomonas_salina.1